MCPPIRSCAKLATASHLQLLTSLNVVEPSLLLLRGLGTFGGSTITLKSRISQCCVLCLLLCHQAALL